MSVSGPSGTEHHVTACNCTFMHFSEMDCTEMDFEGSFVTEGLETDGALNTTFPCV